MSDKESPFHNGDTKRYLACFMKRAIWVQILDPSEIVAAAKKAGKL